MKVLVLGASGMLGAMVTDVLARDSELKVTASARSGELLALGKQRIPEAAWVPFTAGETDPAPLLKEVEWVVNAIGITKPLIHDDSAFEVERALRVNSLFPHALAKAAEAQGTRVLQIATDCVYSGQQGQYQESAAHDALDVYGKTKSLGETYSDAMHHLRCSIIGPEIKDFRFLLEWFRRQEKNATINGFTNHQWNGVTTLQFAKLCRGVIKSGLKLGHLQHVIPGDALAKSDMLKVFAEAYGRPDIRINETQAAKVIDRILQTGQPEQNASLWKAAGYPAPPTVADMIREVSRFDLRLALAGSAV